MKQIGRFQKRRQRKKPSVLCDVEIFLLKVKREDNDWPEMRQRKRIRAAPRKAAKLVKKTGLRRAIEQFGDRR